ncbi:MAG: hypothetical protein ACREVK_07600 [Gammaproteobacteria bacterium]
MQLKKLLEQWDLNSLKIKAGFLEMEWIPQIEDKSAAWDLYAEMLTRVVTQRLVPGQDQEADVLNSAYQLFPLTRDIIKRNGRHCINFAKIAIVVLNQIVRPFTTKWHTQLEGGGVRSEPQALEFRNDLVRLQTDLRKYARLLADLAEVEDLTDLEQVEG